MTLNFASLDVPDRYTYWIAGLMNGNINTILLT